MVTRRIKHPTEGILDISPTQQKKTREPQVSLPTTKPFDFSRGFYAGASPFTGAPQTTEEAKWIRDFVGKYGVRPTPEAVPREFQRTGTYRPGSTMFELGFRSPADYLRAQREGLTYGAFGGGLVPFGGVVTTTEEGDPLQRYFDISQGFARRDIAKGRFVPTAEAVRSQVRHPTEGIIQTSQFGRGFEGVDFPQPQPSAVRPQDVYPQITPLAPFQAPQPFWGDLTQHRSDTGLPDTIDPKTGATIAPVGDFWRNPDVYRLYEDAVRLYYDQQVETGQMTEEGKERALDRALYLGQTGVPANQLPFFKQGLEQRNLASFKTYEQIFRENLNNFTLQLAESEFETKRQGFEASLAQKMGGRGVQGRERPEYAEFVDNLNLSPAVQDWMMANYSLLYNQWIGSGAGISFVDFVTEMAEDEYIALLSQG